MSLTEQFNEDISILLSNNLIQSFDGLYFGLGKSFIEIYNEYNRFIENKIIQYRLMGEDAITYKVIFIILKRLAGSKENTILLGELYRYYVIVYYIYRRKKPLSYEKFSDVLVEVTEITPKEGLRFIQKSPLLSDSNLSFYVDEDGNIRIAV